MENLLEAYLYANENFLDKLINISRIYKDKSGRIAQALVDIITFGTYIDDKYTKQNYFNVTDKEDLVSFSSDKKIKGFTNPYSIENRDEIKIGKIIRNLSKDKTFLYKIDIELTDKDIENFVNIYKSLSNIIDKKFVVVNGDDIAKYYDENKYFSSNGTLGSSCMRDQIKKIFKIYTENPKKVQLLLLLDDNDFVHGRALLWKLKKSPCEAKYFMDRIYTIKDHDKYKFIEHAKEKGYLYKQSMNCYTDENINFIYNNNKIKGEITVKLDGDFKIAPFLDTLCFLNKDKDILSNIPSKKCYYLQDTEGSVSRCDNCDGDILDHDDFCNTCSDGLEILIKNNISCSFKK